MYNSPVLFYESETITEQLTPNSHFVKAAIICDEAFSSHVEAFEKSFYDTPVQTHFYKELTNVRQFIAAQKMGTCFYVVGKWDDVVTIFTTAVEEGVSEAEIQVKIVDAKRKYVYCMKCFTSSEVNPEAENVQCACGAHLNVGPFYSKVRKGYIGYPFVPENEEVRA